MITNRTIIFFAHVSLLFLFLVTTASAQILIPQVGASFSSSTLTSDDTDPHSTERLVKTGLAVGCGIRIPLKDNLSLQSGLYYTEKGSRTEHEARENIHKLNHTFQVVEVPFSLVVGLDKENRDRAFLRFGATLSRVVGGDVRVYYHYPPEQQVTYEVPVGFDDRIEGLSGDKYYIARPMDIGIHAAVGYAVKKRINLEAAFTHGTQKFDLFFRRLATLRTLSITVGYLIQLPKR